MSGLFALPVKGSMQKIVPLLLISASVVCCEARVPIEEVDRLPNIAELRIIDGKSVHLRAPHRHMHRLSREGGLIEDRLYIDAGTGQLEVKPDARKPDEMTLTVGERAQDGMANEWVTFELLEIKGNRAVFRLTGVTRTRRPLDRLVTVREYGAP